MDPRLPLTLLLAGAMLGCQAESPSEPGPSGPSDATTTTIPVLEPTHTFELDIDGAPIVSAAADGASGRKIFELPFATAPAIMAMGTGPHGGAPDMDEVLEPSPAPRPAKAPAAPAPSRATHSAEALSALQNLGYAPGEAAQAVATAASEAAQADTATLIRAALKLLAPKG